MTNLYRKGLKRDRCPGPYSPLTNCTPPRPLPPPGGGGEVEHNFRLQNFNPNDKLIYIIDLLTQFLNDQTVNYTFTLFWTVQQHIPNVQQHMLNVQQHIPNVQQHMLNVQQHIPMVQQHIWST